LRAREDYRQILRDEFGLAIAEADLDATMTVMAKHDPDQPYDGRFA
jgi:hypothetical protein